MNTGWHSTAAELRECRVLQPAKSQGKQVLDIHMLAIHVLHVIGQASFSRQLQPVASPLSSIATFLSVPLSYVIVLPDAMSHV